MKTANNRCKIIDQIETELEQLQLQKNESDIKVKELIESKAALAKTLEEKESLIKMIESRNLELSTVCSNSNIVF